jgi:hypothetical protein
MHNWNIFGALTSHGQTWIHKIHHDLDLTEATTFPIIIFFVPSHGAITQISFCLETPKLRVLKFSKLGLSWLWGPITFHAYLWLKWGLKQSCSFYRKLFKGTWNVTYTQVNQCYYQLLMVRNQIGNLTPGPSFGHQLYFKYPNGSCEHILNIHVPRSFQWYKKIVNPMSFEPYNRPLKIQKSIKTSTPKVGAHLGVWGFILSHSPTFPIAWNVIPGLHS